MKMMPDWTGNNYLARFGVFLTVVALIAGMAGCVRPAGSPVTFADPNLEAAVRKAIAKPTGDIYHSD